MFLSNKRILLATTLSFLLTAKGRTVLALERELARQTTVDALYVVCKRDCNSQLNEKLMEHSRGTVNYKLCLEGCKDLLR